MRIHTMLTSSAALAALCGALLLGGCGGGTSSEDEGANPTLRGGELGGAFPSAGGSGEAGAAPRGEDKDGKLTICHVPPGNPANAHTITIGSPGWNGHQNHEGDYAGPCHGSDGEPGDDTSEPGEPDGGGGTEEPDAEPICVPEASPCGDGALCCDGLECREGSCSPPIIY